MGSHEMHFPLGHHLPLGNLTAAARAWSLGGSGTVWSKLHTPEYTPLLHCGWASSSATAPTGPCTHGSLLSSKERFRLWMMGMTFLLKVKQENVGGHSHCCGQTSAPAHSDRAVPISDLQQSRGDSFQCPQRTCQALCEPESAPTEPHIPIWPVCPSALLGCCSWGSLLVLVVLRLSWVGGKIHAREAWWLLSFPILDIRAEPPALPWLLHAATRSSSINTTGKSINFTALIDVLL